MLTLRDRMRYALNYVEVLNPEQREDLLDELEEAVNTWLIDNAVKDLRNNEDR